MAHFTISQSLPLTFGSCHQCFLQLISIICEGWVDETAVNLTNNFKCKKTANLNHSYSPIGRLWIHFLQLLTEAGEVRVGQSVAFLTAAAVTPNELMNLIA